MGHWGRATAKVRLPSQQPGLAGGKSDPGAGPGRAPGTRPGLMDESACLGLPACSPRRRGRAGALRGGSVSHIRARQRLGLRARLPDEAEWQGIPTPATPRGGPTGPTGAPADDGRHFFGPTSSPPHFADFAHNAYAPGRGAEGEICTSASWTISRKFVHYVVYDPSNLQYYLICIALKPLALPLYVSPVTAEWRRQGAPVAACTAHGGARPPGQRQWGRPRGKNRAPRMRLETKCFPRGKQKRLIPRRRKWGRVIPPPRHF